MKPQEGMEGPCLERKIRGSLSGLSSLCVSLHDLDSLVIHKAQLPALSQEMLPFNAPHLTATEQIPICSGLDPREKRQELCSPLREGSSPLPLPHQPEQSPSRQSPHPMPSTSL